MITLELPYPPSVNHYWRQNYKRGHTYISQEGLTYRDRVFVLVRNKRVKTMKGRLRVVVEVYPPDRRRRDLDNTQKALNDSMQNARVFEDDCQIDDLRIIRREPVKGGKVVVHIEEIGETQ